MEKHSQCCILIPLLLLQAEHCWVCLDHLNQTGGACQIPAQSVDNFPAGIFTTPLFSLSKRLSGMSGYVAQSYFNSVASLNFKIMFSVWTIPTSIIGILKLEPKIVIGLILNMGPKWDFGKLKYNAQGNF